MNARRKPSRGLVAALISASLSLACGTALAAEPRKIADVLDEPAHLSQKATTSLLNAVANAGPRLVAVGERGIILLSDDQGNQWRQAKVVPSSVALTAVRFVNAELGWAVGHGGIVLHSRDGGETWTRQFDGRQAAAIEQAAADAEAATNLVADASAPSPTRRQRDAARIVAEGPDKPFLDVYFATPEKGLVVGAYGLAFVTHDGGKTWSSLIGQIDNPRARHLYNIAIDGPNLLISGEQGTLLRSTNGGESFAALPITYHGTLFGALAASDQSILVFGLRGNAFRSADQGQSWQTLDFGQPVTLTAGTRLRDGRLIIVDETGRVMLSVDNGNKFSSLPTPKINAATGVVETADGGLLLTTQRGPVRLTPGLLGSEQKK